MCILIATPTYIHTNTYIIYIYLANNACVCVYTWRHDCMAHLEWSSICSQLRVTGTMKGAI